MRLMGGARIVLLAVVASTAVSACVSAPAPNRPALRVLPGGAGGMPPTPAPSITARPEPPIGVIMSGRVVIGCDMGSRCTYFARLSPLRTEAPDPTAPPETATPATVTLVGVDVESRGFGPTARIGSPGAQEPSETALLLAGMWHIDAWTTTIGLQPTELGPSATRMSCGLDFELRPGQALSLNLAHGTSGCMIHLGAAIIP
jgi:hypothetical protein